MAGGDGEAGSQRRLPEGAVRVKEPIRLSQAKRKKKKKPSISQPGPATTGVCENADSQEPPQRPA